MLGVAILLIVTSVMSGFNHDIREGIMSMQAHLNIVPAWKNNFEKPNPYIDRLAKYGINATPVIEGTAMIQLRNTIVPKVIRGIDPEREKKVTSIQQNIENPNYKIKEGEVVIGKRLALALNLHIGDKFLIHSPARLTENIKWGNNGQVTIQKPDEMYLPEEVTVGAYYSMGVSDYDDNIIIMHLDQAADLFGMDWGSATSIQATVQDPMNMLPLMQKLRQNFPQLQFTTWQEKNEMLFNTLNSEKSLMTFLMTFIVLVASFSIAATLITVVVQKTREIGVMKAVGVSNWMVARIFLFQGSMIGLIGTTLGSLAGGAVILWRDQVAAVLSWFLGHNVFPAELYHLTHIPAYITPGDFARIVIMSLLICIFAALIPAIYASSLPPARAIQEEH